MTTFTPGERVLINSNRQRDHGKVATASHDTDGARIGNRRIPVEVDNGQGTWGFRPSELTKIQPQPTWDDTKEARYQELTAEWTELDKEQSEAWPHLAEWDTLAIERSNHRLSTGDAGEQ